MWNQYYISYHYHVGMEDGCTVVLPTYNEEGNIGRMVTTLREMYPDFYVLVMDDNSKDRTKEIVEGISATCRIGTGSDSRAPCADSRRTDYRSRSQPTGRNPSAHRRVWQRQDCFVQYSYHAGDSCHLRPFSSASKRSLGGRPSCWGHFGVGARTIVSRTYLLTDGRGF